LETTRTFTIRDYDLAATLTCGQVFRWQQQDRSLEVQIALRLHLISRPST